MTLRFNAASPPALWPPPAQAWAGFGLKQTISRNPRISGAIVLGSGTTASTDMAVAPKIFMRGSKRDVPLAMKSKPSSCRVSSVRNRDPNCQDETVRGVVWFGRPIEEWALRTCVILMHRRPIESYVAMQTQLQGSVDLIRWIFRLSFAPRKGPDNGQGRRTKSATPFRRKPFRPLTTSNSVRTLIASHEHDGSASAALPDP